MRITKIDSGDGEGSVLYVVKGTQHALRMDGDVMLLNTPEWMNAAEARRTAAVLLAAAEDAVPTPAPTPRRRK